ncbi:sulfite exporter TauE/SafE family protein [Acrocarpospora catenulata]|uniref:sulfite exporter TauE/SafE family protein n=1 Tax=Acrocarpospora catenulata TaxID=2836182 RepID=UPI001BD99F9A|nr:sulfite exporter TauE/SafE family protein [Acrocarpospora catenulata]
MSAGALFGSGLAAGLLAGTASCTAMQGGLLTGLARVRGDVALFLGGRLGGHVLIGAALGLIGSAAKIGPTVRAVLLILAGLLVLFFGVRALRRDHCAPADIPATPGRWRAFLLGVATVLMPCGVTISMEIVAISTGSAVEGAAVMAGFVLGSTPGFALLGVLIRLAGAKLIAVAALLAAFVTIGAGLRLGGWLPSWDSPAVAATLAADGSQHLTIWATEAGFRPSIAAASAGHPIEITFRTQDNTGCTRTLTINGQDLALPESGSTEIRLPPHGPGTLRYTCGMGMYAGVIRIN